MKYILFVLFWYTLYFDEKQKSPYNTNLEKKKHKQKTELLKEKKFKNDVYSTQIVLENN